MNFENLIYEMSGNIAVIKINNPKSLNALNPSVLKDLQSAFEQAGKDDSVCAVVLTGEGKAFVAGADISAMSTMNALDARAFADLGLSVFRSIEMLEKPVIAAVNGFALGGGCELAMACDIRLASDKAKFGQPEVGLGITPGFAGTQRLSRLVGSGIAKELIFTADIIDAAEAYRIGLVNKVYTPEELMNEAMKLAEKIVSKGNIAVTYSKMAINRGLETDMDTAMEIERNLFALCFSTEDQKEGMKAFLEKRPAEFKGK